MMRYYDVDKGLWLRKWIDKDYDDMKHRELQMVSDFRNLSGSKLLLTGSRTELIEQLRADDERRIWDDLKVESDEELPKHR